MKSSGGLQYLQFIEHILVIELTLLLAMRSKIDKILNIG